VSRAFVRALAAEAALPYRAAGPFAWRFARGKLAGDPLFAALLRQGLVPDGACILDLGCGQGLLAAWLLAARRLFEAGTWPDHWPAPPRLGGYRGIELLPAEVKRGRAALSGAAEIEAGNVRCAKFGRAGVVAVFDVLHFLDETVQSQVLARAREALAPGGVLLLRVGDAAGGWRFRYSVAVDRTVARVRGHRLAGFHCRTAAGWEALLQELGYSVEGRPVGGGMPFANVLLVARRRGEPKAAAPEAPAIGPGTRTPGGRASR
jgi:SAM-dependent methyltransferase